MLLGTNQVFMKTKKELESLKNDMARLRSRLVELSDEELSFVTGGRRENTWTSYNITAEKNITMFR